IPTAIAAAATYKIARRTARRSCNERKPITLILSSQRANNRHRARYESPRWLERPPACALDGARVPGQHLIQARCRCHKASLRERSSGRPGLDAAAGAPKLRTHVAGAAAERRQRLRLVQ